MDYLIALGGSIICPKEIDIDFLVNFKFLIKNRIKNGDRFVIVTGGGNTARKYQEALSKIKKINQKEKDLIGIRATKINADLLKSSFNEFSDPVIVEKRNKLIGFNDYKVIVASGWTPGRSTDFVAVQIAIDLTIDTVLVLTNQDYVYDKNPEKNIDARPLNKLKWNDYMKIIPNKWTPGLKVPFDPIASSLAEKENKKVVLIGGKNLTDLDNFFNKKEFKGTTIF